MYRYINMLSPYTVNIYMLLPTYQWLFTLLNIDNSFHGLKELPTLYYYNKSLRVVPKNRRSNSLNFTKKCYIYLGRWGEEG